MSTDLVLLEKSISAAFVEAFRAETDKIFQSEVPILVSAAGVTKNKKLLSQAIAKGAKVVYGDADAVETTDTRMRPIIIDGLTPDMDLYRQEAFGPTAGLVYIENENEAIRITNATEHGLSAAIFTNDLGRAFRVARQIDSGAVHINCMTVHDEANLPHGGIKRSGWGRFNASDGIEEFLRTKTVTWQE
jgi:acyl-CoA reductase-like NAD-dependent aldehyde dehydrogenase